MLGCAAKSIQLFQPFSNEMACLKCPWSTIFIHKYIVYGTSHKNVNVLCPFDDYAYRRAVGMGPGVLRYGYGRCVDHFVSNNIGARWQSTFVVTIQNICNL